jgi:metal-responsive CopG/Arc/MetJ family transcriptional regulator
MTKDHKQRIQNIINEIIYEHHPQTLDDDLADVQDDYTNRLTAVQEIISYLEGELE